MRDAGPSVGSICSILGLLYLTVPKSSTFSSGDKPVPKAMVTAILYPETHLLYQLLFSLTRTNKHLTKAIGRRTYSVDRKSGNKKANREVRGATTGPK